MKMRAGCAVLAAMLTVCLLSGCQSSSTKAEKSATAAAEPKMEKKAASKSVPPKHEYNVAWQQDCTVQQAFSASRKVLEDLDLKVSGSGSRTVQTRDPKTGRTIRRNVPYSGGRSDDLSAQINADSVAGIGFELTFLLLPPKSCEFSILAASSKQEKEILKKQSHFLKARIMEAIQQDASEPEAAGVADKGLEAFILDCTMGQAYDLIYQWGKKWNFNQKDAGGDSFTYKYLSYIAGSDIRFDFKFRMIDSQKTKLELEVNNTDGKDEYAVIRRSLNDAIKGGPSVTTASYADTKLLEKTIFELTKALEDWAQANRLSWKEGKRDVFYSSGYCYTSSGIYLSFTMRRIDANQTRLEITASKYEGKDEFPMVLKSLEAALAELEKPAEVVEAAAETTS